MDLRMFVTVFSGVGGALAAMLLALGLVQLIQPEPSWQLVQAGIALAVIVGVASWLVYDLNRRLNRSSGTLGAGVGMTEGDRGAGADQ